MGFQSLTSLHSFVNTLDILIKFLTITNIVHRFNNFNCILILYRGISDCTITEFVLKRTESTVEKNVIKNDTKSIVKFDKYNSFWEELLWLGLKTEGSCFSFSVFRVKDFCVIWSDNI